MAFTAAAVVGAGVMAGSAFAQTGNNDSGARPAPESRPSFPTFVHLPQDLAAHPAAGNEWSFLSGRLSAAHGHTFAYVVQIVRDTTFDAVHQPESEISITDLTTGKYYTQTVEYAPDQASFSTTALDEKLPTASLSGPTSAMRLHATVPGAALDLTLKATGASMYANGTGQLPFLGGSASYVSLPTVETTGSIVEKGMSFKVSGTSWLDKMYGNFNWATAQKWTRMTLQLSNGDRIALWDLFSRTDQDAASTENSYATVLHPNGTEEIVAVDPLAKNASGFTTSATSGQRFATKWTVGIPSLKAKLAINTVGPALQEINDAGGIFEGVGSITGTYGGTRVTGTAHDEELGNWHPSAAGK